MPSLLRLLLPNRPHKPPPDTRATRRDSVAMVLADGRRIDVLRVRDPRARRLKLSVDERGARLTLPWRASLISGERFLYEHRDWLTAQLALQPRTQADGLQRDVTACLPLRGEDLPLRWQPGRFTALREDADGCLFQTTARAGEAALRRALRDFYEAQARADIGRWLPRYLPGLPRAPARIRLKPMSSQWGSLAPDDTLSLDLALVLGRPAAFEYVLVHELCHLIRADHSRTYWREVEARCPDWRDQRDYFKTEGRRLKARLHALLSA